MSGFVATAPTAATSETDAIANDGWFPNLSMTQLRAVARLDGTVTEERLRDAARYAMSAINRRLAAFKAAHQATGVTKLADVPDAGTIDGENRLVMLYRRAVQCTVKADLIERYRDFDSTDSGLRRADYMDPAIGEQRRNATWAVREILGQPHTIVELI
ncbi:MAG TPA: head completion/stabilization protein [Lysobacter sp.]|nr:head completion/stabilization protein [Lysobacter sp.]